MVIVVICGSLACFPIYIVFLYNSFSNLMHLVNHLFLAFWYIYIHPSIHPSIHLSIYLPSYLSIYLSIYYQSIYIYYIYIYIYIYILCFFSTLKLLTLNEQVYPELHFKYYAQLESLFYKQQKLYCGSTYS